MVVHTPPTTGPIATAGQGGRRRLRRMGLHARARWLAVAIAIVPVTFIHGWSDADRIERRDRDRRFAAEGEPLAPLPVKFMRVSLDAEPNKTFVPHEVNAGSLTAQPLSPQAKHLSRDRRAAETSVSVEVLAGGLAAQPLLPRGRYHRRDDKSAETASPLEVLAGRLAAQFESYRPSRVGIVTRATRRGFWVNLGTLDGLRTGLLAEVRRLTPESSLGPDDILGGLTDLEFLGSRLPAETAPVTRARVVKVYADSALLRPADPPKGRRVDAGDMVEIIGTRLRLFVGDISGDVPGAATEALRNLLLEKLEGREDIRAIRPPYDAAGLWLEGKTGALCKAGLEEGCDYATAGTVHLDGDTLHVAMGLVHVSSCETVRFLTASVEADPALIALAARISEDEHPAGKPLHPSAEWDMGSCSPYETSLRPAFKVELQGRALASFVLSDVRALCVAYDTSLETYSIDPKGRLLARSGRYDLSPFSLPQPCRDPAGRIAMADSDGDGREELVLWSTVLESPVAFSITPGEGREELRLDPADIFWLPWSEPYGDVRYIQGMNYMTVGDAAGSIDFYDYRSADLDGDGHKEDIYTQTSGTLLVSDTARGRSVELEAGAPLEAHDMNMDGLPELVVSAARLPGERDALTFYNYVPDGPVESWRINDLPGGVISLAAGLLDGDGLPDLVVLLEHGVRAEVTTLLVMLTAQQPDPKAGPGLER